MSATAKLKDPHEHSAFPLVPINKQSAELTPNQWRSTDVDLSRPIPESKPSNSSDETSSDKLSALPVSPPPSHKVTRNIPEPSNPSSSIDVGPPSPSITPYRLYPSPNNALGTRVTSPPTSEGSVDRDQPKGRTSGESDRRSLPAMQSVRQTFSRIRRASDATRRPQPDDSRSHSPSRIPSPLRIFQQLSAGFHRGYRDDPFIPVDPFRFHFHFPCISRRHHHHHHHQHLHMQGSDHRHGACNTPQPCNCFLLPLTLCSDSSCTESAVHFLTDALPRQIYLHILLRLPALYFRRVARIFEDAEVSRPDIQRMIDAWSYGADMSTVEPSGGANADWSPPAVSPALARFKNSWEAFIDSLLREWKTLNVVSALLSTAIVTVLQIPSAADDPVTRYAALLSLVASLMSLSYGCVYIVRFATMRSMYKASKWAEEAQKTKTMILWNVWVLLAMPSVWIAWSMIFFIVCVVSFVWRTGPLDDPPRNVPFSPQAALVARTTVTTLLALGILYFAMIVLTLKRYGRGTGDLDPTRVDRTDGGAVGPIGAGGLNVANDLEAALSRRGRRRERGSAVAGATTDGGLRGEEATREEWVGNADESGPVVDSGLGLTMMLSL